MFILIIALLITFLVFLINTLISLITKYNNLVSSYRSLGKVLYENDFIPEKVYKEIILGKKMMLEKIYFIYLDFKIKKGK